jgi:carboxyl-terminal processing protease
MRKRRNILLDGLILGITLSLGNSSISAEIETPALPTETQESQALPFDELRQFTEVFARIKQVYVDSVTDKKLFEDAERGMLSGLDPHSDYMDSIEFKEFQEVTTGQFAGLGIEVGMEDGFLKVITPIDETPAQRAGIKAGDTIVKFDSKPVKGLTPAETIKLMRGDVGSKIVLTVVREGENAPLKFALTRDTIHKNSVIHGLLEHNYGYLRINSFQSGTGQSLLEAIDTLKKENAGPLNGLVLDLRNNPGGVVNDAVEVCDAFLDTGLIVSTAGRIQNSEMRFSATPGDVMNGSPIVVLINGGSASAAEIVAGALQDQKRAIIMGEKSFGKGTVQAVLPMSNGAAIKLTIARYFTPSGRSIQAEGIQPDVKLAKLKLESLDKVKIDSIKEADLVHHLLNANSEKINATEDDKTITKENAAGDAKTTRDYALNEALNLLKGLGIMANITHPQKM